MKKLKDGTQISDSNEIFALFDARVFSVTTSIQVVSGTAESDLLLLTNPPGSGKLIVGQYISFGADSSGANTILRSYAGPTITANGTALTIRNNRISATPFASVMTAFLSPTISARGVLVAPFIRAGGQSTIRYERAFIVEPGISVLGTAQNSQNNTPTHIDIIWREVDL